MDFVGRWVWGWGWMGDASKLVPKFIAKHSEHLEYIRMISEHDAEWEEAEDFEPHES